MVMRSKAASASSFASLKRIGGVLLPIIAVIYLIFTQANFLIGRALLVAFGDYDTRYKSASLEWDGDVVAKDFVLYPYDAEDEQTAIRFEHVHLETPGWFWFLRNAFDRKLQRARLSRLHLTLTGGSSAAGIDPSLGDLGPFGAISASPFEAEGCMEDTQWIRDELVAMGLTPAPTTLEFDYRAEGGDLLTTVILETKGSSRVQLDRVATLPGLTDSGLSSVSGLTNMLLLDYIADETRSERWEIQDQGFVAARNRYCAKKDKVEPLRFVDRHVESVMRLMDTVGVSIDSDSRTSYRRFARDGGKLVYSIAYTKALPAEMLYELRGHSTVLATSHASIDHNGRVRSIRWQKFDPIPLPALDEGEPTFAALQKERSSTIRGEDAATLSDASVASAADAAATVATLPVAPDTGDSPIASGSADPNAANAASAEATPVTGVEPPSVAPTDAASDTATVSMPIDSVAAALPSLRPGARLQWSDLLLLQGRLVRVWTVHNPPRTVEILTANGNTLRVTARLGGGNAEYTIQRGAFLRASLVR